MILGVPHHPGSLGLDRMRAYFRDKDPCSDPCERLRKGARSPGPGLSCAGDGFPTDKAVTSARCLPATNAACQAASADVLAKGATGILCAPDAASRRTTGRGLPCCWT
jgi:hypothetical protein